ncbi:hypothetical protein [Bradyrhizobium sp.]|uniref:hypothetical protein n=1 Tax=Bradyrhizobium sp. TaxID=376 RepID=UPI002732D01E|nr:hypothetical protein [Bradyrhizobium sp.]MDP3074890.1 hypothetical protein [Bradyrhizobium sp.]
MKLRIMSDLHLDHPRSDGPPPLAAGADMAIVAGDTRHSLVKGIEHLRRAYPAPTEVVMDAGNHELWSRELSFEKHFAEGRRAGDLHDVHLLENNVGIVDNLRLPGCTLWMDYELFGSSLRGAAMRVAAETMVDHRRIQVKPAFKPAFAVDLPDG